ncbi:MAG: prefoldin subunit alpha [Candidatus Norongarragalinales archaeon]
MASEQEMQRMALEMQAYRQRAEEVQGQMRSLAAFVQESDSAVKAMESLAEGETLFPIGSGVFVKAKPASKTVIVEIGARVMAEKTVDEAKALLQERKDGFIKALSKLQEELEELNSAMVALSEKARQK